ncbi:hypothetical protein BGY98DRAFT_932357 [Russula aff. rugulosa BPL654]|nr:hypothetical protein BGY98DRAFT_932357 [Russula aff. rugulosa BPL654]
MDVPANQGPDSVMEFYWRHWRSTHPLVSQPKLEVSVSSSAVHKRIGYCMTVIGDHFCIVSGHRMTTRIQRGTGLRESGSGRETCPSTGGQPGGRIGDRRRLRSVPRGSIISAVMQANRLSDYFRTIDLTRVVQRKPGPRERYNGRNGVRSTRVS